MTIKLTPTAVRVLDRIGARLERAPVSALRVAGSDLRCPGRYEGGSLFYGSRLRVERVGVVPDVAFRRPE